MQTIGTMKSIVGIFLLLLFPSLASGFAPARRNAVMPNANPTVVSAPLVFQTTKDADDCRQVTSSFQRDDRSNSMLVIPAATVLFTALPVEAAGVVPAALWAYAHYLSILAITGCLVAEKVIVKPNMSVDDEDYIVKIDLVYGLMAALLIISGFARAAKVNAGCILLEGSLTRLFTHLSSSFNLVSVMYTVDYSLCVALTMCSLDKEATFTFTMFSFG